MNAPRFHNAGLNHFLPLRITLPFLENVQIEEYSVPLRFFFTTVLNQIAFNGLTVGCFWVTLEEVFTAEKFV